MRFLAPLGFLFAAALPVIVAFYLLKLRRVRRDVPSTLLWRRAAEDLHANAPFQKLRRNLLLILQLLVAALLVVGLARPYLNMKSGRTKHTVLLVDHSASMGSKDKPGGPTRLAQALDQAKNYVRGMADSDSAMVIAFADRANVVCQFTNDKTTLENALGKIRQSDLPTVASEAFSLAQSLGRPVRAGLRIYSDGAFSDEQLQVAEGVTCDFVSIGAPSDNVGIVTMDLRRPPENTRQFEVFATLRNYAEKERRARLEVVSQGKLVDAKDITLPASAESAHVFTSTQLGKGRVELRLDADDSLASDDNAFAIVKDPTKRKLVVVSAGNYFLDRVLREDSSHQLEVITVAPNQFSFEQKADVYIFDNFMPTAPLPAGNYFVINSKPSVPGYAEQGVEEQPAIFDWDQQSPIMRYVELGDVQVRRAKKYALPAATQVLAESKDTPLISIYSAENRNIVLWSFDLFESNLPLRVAFPLLISNSLDWLLRDVRGSDTSVVHTGQVLQADAPGAMRNAVMKSPEGFSYPLVPSANGRLSFDRTSKAGFYTLDINGTKAEEFAASVLSVAESNNVPRASLNLQGGRQLQSRGAEMRTNREVWKWLAAGALAFLMLEWLIYHRRLWV